MNAPILYPRQLRQGDKIAIVSPASIINPDYVEGAVETVEAAGFVPVVMPNALGHSGSYSGSVDERIDDLTKALLDPQVRAIVCSRGGYGVVHLLDALSRLPLADDPKWLVGFSDISALHALMQSKGIASIHASMAKQLAQGVDNPLNRRLFRLLQGESLQYGFPAHSCNRQGRVEGTLIGGNLAVLAGLIDTPFDILKPGVVLFIEDIAEPIYKVERILYQLRLNGVLPRLKGLIVGQFTEYKADANYSSIEAMIAEMVEPYDYPVAFNAPIGHVDFNQPIIEGAEVSFSVCADGAKLIYKKNCGYRSAD